MMFHLAQAGIPWGFTMADLDGEDVAAFVAVRTAMDESAVAAAKEQTWISRYVNG